MTMISKIADRHLSRQACIYVRQSTLAQVRSKQGQRLEEIGKAMGQATKGLKLPVSKLLAAKKLKTKGQKRGTMYFARDPRLT